MTDWRIIISPNFAADARKEILPCIAVLMSAYSRMICDDWVLAARDVRRGLRRRAA